MVQTVKRPVPLENQEFVKPISWFVFEVSTDNPAGLNKALLDVYLKIGPQVDVDYPVIPDTYYGGSVNADILKALASVEDPVGSGFRRLVYWGGAAFSFEVPADTRSESVSVSNFTQKFVIKLEKPLGYGVEHFFRIRYAGEEWIYTSIVENRPFYSPSLGDTQSAYETTLYSTDFSAKLPECYHLRNLAIAAFDDRHPILAARRLMKFLTENIYGFIPDERAQLKQGFRTLKFDNVLAPKSWKNIDSSLGLQAMAQATRAITELRNNKKVPAEWWEPAMNAMDFLNVDLVHRVRIIAQIVFTATRAIADGLL